jgi:hypothetical protein
MKEHRTGEAEFRPLLRVRLLDGGMVKSSIIRAPSCNHVNLTIGSDGVYIRQRVGLGHDEAGENVQNSRIHCSSKLSSKNNRESYGLSTDS